MTRRNENIIYPPGLKKEVWLILIFCCFTPALWGAISLDIPKTLLPPKIDGILNDEVWKNAKGYSDFISFFPDYGKLCEEKTLVYSAYDADNLFFAFKCYDRSPGKIIATLGKRDTIGGEDLVAVYIDSHNDGQNAYTFIINPLGIQLDGITDSNDSADFSSDLVWESAGVMDNEGYTIEVKVPFTTLRFSQAKIVKMKIGFLRKISRYTEQYAFPEWKPGGAMITQLGLGQFEGIKYKRVMELLPAATYMKRRERDAGDQFVATADKDLGLTAKIGLTSDLTLDLTYNPDFSHIEMDEGQVDVNLRVDPLYEEKRPFFQEGLEHFKFAGCIEGMPIEKIVNTRAIIEPIWGLKLSGKIGHSGIINSLFTLDESPTYFEDLVSTEERKTIENSYVGIFRYKYLFKKDCYVGGIYTGLKYRDGYHHVGGVDSKIRFSRFITAEAFFLHSLSKPSDSVDLFEGSAWTGNINFENREYNVSLGYQDLARDFNLEIGRLTRYGIRVFSANAERYIFLKSNFLKLITLVYSGRLSRDKDSRTDEYSHEFYVNLRLPSFTSLTIGYNFATEVYKKILFDKDTFYIEFDSRFTKQLHLNFSYSSGEFPLYDELLQGNTNVLHCSLNFQPGNKFSTEFMVTRQSFHRDEGNYNNYNYSIYRNKTTFQVNKYLFLRGVVEYNDYYKRVLLDCLAGFLQIPGPGIYLGYGSTLERGFEDMGFYRYDRLKETRSGLFFKASYLFRF